MRQKELALALKSFLVTRSQALGVPLRQVVLTPTFDVELAFIPTATPSAAVRALGVGIEAGKGERVLRYRYGIAFFERWVGTGEPDAERALDVVDRLADAFTPQAFADLGVALTHVVEVGEMETTVWQNDRYVFQAIVVEMMAVEVGP